MSRAKKWCFTLNNPTSDESSLLGNFWVNHHATYLVYGKETGESGTPHYQGFVIFHERKRLPALRAILPRAHWEVARGTPQQAADYCKKEGDFEEHGTLPTSTQGKRNDWERLKSYVEELGRKPKWRELWIEFPGLMGRYEYGVNNYLSALLPPDALTDSTPREGWQQDLYSRTQEEPGDRQIEFVIDYDGGKGKTWFTQYMLDKHPDETQVLRIGKRDDLAHCIDPHKSIFLIDVPRKQMDLLQYPILEMLKDRIVFSPKYHSMTKILYGKCHVIVFCNEDPDLTAMSTDRYLTTYV